MKTLYQIFSQIFLFLPIIPVISNCFLTEKMELQKKINISVYSVFLVLLCGLYFFCAMYGEYYFTLLSFSFDGLLSFSVNRFNLFFGIITTATLLPFIYTFQNSFVFLKLTKKAVLYLEQFLCILLFTYLIIFSNNIITSFFYYILLLISALFLLKNPELKDLRNRYLITFLLGLISAILLIILFSSYYYSYNNILFRLQNPRNVSFYSIYYVISSLVLLSLTAFVYPIYHFIKEKLYYEDFLPSFTIYFFPFIFCGIFLFSKITYFLFYNDFNNLSLYFYYIGYFLVALFITSVVFSILNIKNVLKFTIIFNVSNFLVFLSQMLFVVGPLEFKKYFLNFIVLIPLIFTNILTYSGILFYLLNSGTNSIQILYTKSKWQINFYLISLLSLIIFNSVLFYKLNFYNFNVLYFINFIEIVALFFVFFAFIYFLLMKKIEVKKNASLKEISKQDLYKYFTPSIIAYIIFLIFFGLLIYNKLILFV